jgi:hypothetical protein
LAESHRYSSGGGNRSYATRSYSGRYSRGPSYFGHGYVAPRSYARPIYRPYYRGGVYLNFGVPYGYAYGPGYAYAPGYAYDPSYSYGPAPAPAPQAACTEGTYDQNGAWIPSRDCYPSGQYPQPQQNYGPNQQQQYQQQPQQYYDPNQGQYPQPQPNYYPNQPQR